MSCDDDDTSLDESMMSGIVLTTVPRASSNSFSNMRTYITQTQQIYLVLYGIWFSNSST